MKLTPAKRRLLLAMHATKDMDERAQHRAMLKCDPNSTCYMSLQEHGMVRPPGVLTGAGLELARELFELERSG